MPPAARRNVLIVEDDPQLRDFYKTALRAAGYAVIAVEDGADALRQIDFASPAAVVLDLALPRVGGRDVHYELKARSATQRIPIVVVTGTDTSDLDEKQFACVLRKPVQPDDLVAAVEQCIRRAATGSILSP